MDALPELNAFAVEHDGPDAGETAVVDRAFDNHGHDANDHETDLYHVGPHDSFHTALENTDIPRTHTHTRARLLCEHYAVINYQTSGHTQR